MLAGKRPVSAADKPCLKRYIRWSSDEQTQFLTNRLSLSEPNVKAPTHYLIWAQMCLASALVKKHIFTKVHVLKWICAHHTCSMCSSNIKNSRNIDLQTLSNSMYILPPTVQE